MTALMLAAGAIVVVTAMLDALWTTLWLEGHAGPLARRLASGIHWLFIRLAGGHGPGGRRPNHRLLSIQGPLTPIASVLLWVLVLWTGWVIFFSASPGAVVHTFSGSPASTVERIYFTGYTLLTLGNGDFSPRGATWQLATSTASLTGFGILTLTITYLLSMLEAVVTMRSFATHVFSLGASAEELVLNAWDGRSFAGIDLQLISFVEQLNLVTEQHRAYPMLHYYHAVEERYATPSAVVVLDEALTILRWGVASECRPGPSALRSAREAVRDYLGTLDSAHISASASVPAPPDLARIRAAGIPVVPDGEFRTAVHELVDRRRLLLGALESEAREWPPSDA